MAMLEEVSNIGAAIERLRAPVRQAQHAPGFIYNSHDHLAREKENIFMQDWLFVALEQEVENPGDYMTFRILGEPVLITRDAEGNLNAFANVCLHRGVEVASGSGNLKEFMCPYHGWLYDLTGKLIGAPYMKEAEGFDPTNCNLKRLGIDTWRGYVFITFNDNPPAFADFIAPLVKDVGYLHAEDVRIGNKIEMEFPCNWKFAVENLMDFYHVGVLHSDSFGQFFEWREDGVKLNERGGVYIKYTSASPTPEGKTQFRMLPWLEAAGETERFGCMAYLAPNMHVFGRCDVVRPIQLWPNGPDSTRAVIYHLFPPDWFNDPKFDEKCKIYRDYQIEVLEEDRSMLMSLQSAMGAREYSPGPMSHLEGPIHNTINYHVKRALGNGAD
jgi:choline monooxygenase